MSFIKGYCITSGFEGSLGNFVILQIYLYDCTEVSPYCLLFFGGDISIQKDKDQDTIAVDEWIVFQSPARIAHLVKVTMLNTVYGRLGVTRTLLEISVFAITVYLLIYHYREMIVF